MNIRNFPDLSAACQSESARSQVSQATVSPWYGVYGRQYRPVFRKKATGLMTNKHYQKVINIMKKISLDMAKTTRYELSPSL